MDHLNPADLPEWLKQPAQSSRPSAAELLRQTTPGPPPPAVPLPEKSPVAKLQEYILQGNKMLQRKPLPTSDIVQWLRRVRTALAAVFGGECPLCKPLGSEINKVIKSGLPAAELMQKLEDLQALTDQLCSLGNSPLACQASMPSRAPSTKNVFVIHGHDELNARRLSQMLQDEFALRPIVMLTKPGMSRPLTDKFEDEAKTCSFAFALFTPDDEIRNSGETYVQARPNVIYEAGWFIGRLGKRRVALLLKKGTRIHTDLDGVSQIRFPESIQDKFLEIQKELRAAKVIP